MISVCIAYFYAIYVHYEHRSGQSKNECSYPVPSIFDVIICGFTPSVRMFIGQGLSLEAHRAAQAERQAANTAPAAAAERASSASPTFFALSPPAEMDSIALSCSEYLTYQNIFTVEFLRRSSRPFFFGAPFFCRAILYHVLQ